MANEQVPLIFFKPLPSADPLVVAESILAGSPSAQVVPLDAGRVLRALKETRGFARLKVALPHFSLDHQRVDAALEGAASETHVAVRFSGDFDKLAGPLFKALAAAGFVCYSVWDRTVLSEWLMREEPRIDNGFAARMTRVTQRKERELRETEPDPKRRARMLDAFVKSPEFRAEMAKAARLEGRGGDRRKRAYSGVVNCYVRWRDGRPSASELGAVRKLNSRFAAMGIAELRNLIGDAPRLPVLTAALPRQAAAFREAAERHGLVVDVEPP
jgi:hypothetical protein